MENSNKLKKESKILVKKTFNNFYQIVMKYNFPNDNTSEENKILINIFLEFVKTFGVICFEIPEVFFENGGLDNISLLNLIDYVLNIGNKFFYTFKYFIFIFHGKIFFAR